MTTDPAQNGPPAGRTPANRRQRRFDEGDLWADGAETQTPAPRQPAARRAAPRPPSPAAPPVVPAAVPPQPQTQQAMDLGQPTAAAGYGYEEDDDEYYEDDEPSVFGNPYVLAGVAVAGAIVLAVAVVLLFGRGGDGGAQSPGTTANATRTPTATVDDADPSVTGLAARSIAISTVREGPGLTHLDLGLLPANQDVDVVGRNEEATWFQIVFPAGTQLTGWVPETALRLPEDVEEVVSVVEATPVPRPEVPDPTATTPPVTEETPTPTGEDGPDLAVAIISDCTPGSEIVVNVSYTGPEAIEDEPIEVIVSNDGVVESQRAYQADMDVGASTDLGTGVAAQPPQMAVSVLLTNQDDVDPSNNIASCSVAGGGNGNVPPTPEP